MNLIESDVVLIKETNPLKKIELAGRTCYKSENKITEDSAKSFVSRLIKAGHLAMVEHATFIFSKDFNYILKAKEVSQMLSIIPFTNITTTVVNGNKFRILFSANLRSLLENKLAKFDHTTGNIHFNIENLDFIADLNSVNDLSEEEKLNHKYTTIRFTIDRGVSHEIVRHRLFSFAQESTRYVKYNDNKMTFIKPVDYNNWSNTKKGIFLSACNTAETYYNNLLDNGAVAQEARAVLPNAIKTELVVTGNEKEWLHFFDLRCDKTAHPDCRKVANKAKELYYSKENN